MANKYEYVRKNSLFELTEQEMYYNKLCSIEKHFACKYTESLECIDKAMDNLGIPYEKIEAFDPDVDYKKIALEAIDVMGEMKKIAYDCWDEDAAKDLRCGIDSICMIRGYIKAILAKDPDIDYSFDDIF